MLCAQALAVVAKAVKRLAIGEDLTVRYNTDDVQHDLTIWARDAGHPVEAASPEALRITRGQ